MKTNRKILFAFTCSFLLLLTYVQAQEKKDSIPSDLFEMDLSTLMNMEVTTASKKAQSIDDAPAAIFVITKEDIRYYGFNNVGEALRLVPGIEIIQGGDQNYEVTARGISRSEYNTSNKVLWLIDGRSIYNDALGGVRLESILVSMEDIERIEVIRGAGSSLYGANAFQGIVNIITKKPADQKGVTAKFAYGNYGQMNSSLSYGGVSGKLSYKASFGYDKLDKLEKRWASLDSLKADSLEDMGHVEGTINAYDNKYGNAALIYSLNENASIRVSGGYTKNGADHYFVLPGYISYNDYFGQIDYSDKKNTFRAFYTGQGTKDGYSLTKFMKTISPAENPYLQATHRYQFVDLENVSITNQMFDGEYQRAFNFKDKVSAILGGSYRMNMVQANVFDTTGVSTNKQEGLAAIFTQIEYKPIEKLNIIVGGRFDNHTVVGNNFNPRIATIFKITDEQTLRLGFGTATRNPHFNNMYCNTNMRVANLKKLTGLDPIGNLTANSNYVNYHVTGSTDVTAEKLTSFELGYQISFNKKLQFRLDAFYNQMSNPISYGEVTTVSRVTTVENLSAIFKAKTGDPTFSIPNTGTAIGKTWNDNMTKTEMLTAMNDIQEFVDNTLNPAIAYYSTLGPAGEPYVQAYTKKKNDLLALKAGFNQLQGVYGAPKQLAFASVNKDEIYKYYGAELSFTYVPLKNLTIMGNFSYLDFLGDYNNRILDDLDNFGNHIYTEEQRIKVQQDSKYKGSLGFKYSFKGAYIGVMFNYMSEQIQPFDNNKNGKYDVGDRDNYVDGGVIHIDQRMNLNANIGYKYKMIDVFATGYNLIQDDYLQLPASYACTQGDYLHTRYMGGIRLNF